MKRADALMATIIVAFYVVQIRAEQTLDTTAPQSRPQSDYPVGDPRRCQALGNRILRLEVIPGGGWDNLRNRDAGMVMKLNYSRCLTTDDGRYLIPDGVSTIPKKSSNVDTYAELFMQWNDYRSTLSNSINVHAGLSTENIGISGKFSDEYETVKSRQYNDKSVTTRVQVRYVRYTARTPTDFAIDEALRTRLRKIAADIEMNRTDLAAYESQLIVRDFGTHVTTSVDIGAALVQIDHIQSSYLKKEEFEKNTVLASASASFFGIFNFGVDFSHTTSKDEIDAYLKQKTTSNIATYGGPVFRPTNYPALNWNSSLENDMVALDRSGDPIYYVISSASLPDLPQSTVYKVYDHIKAAVELYYEHNTYRGCTDPDAPNFSLMANENDGSYKPPSNNYTFGGVYQTCTSSGYTNLCADQKLIQNNPLTGGQSCPDEYEAVLLQDGSSNQITRRRECYTCWLFFHCCDDYTYYSSASYSAYWCSAKGYVDQNHGFLFGGLYTSMLANPLTQERSCPSQFYGLKLLKDLTVCVSDDYELGFEFSLPFAGLFSCKSGNPLAMKTSSNLHSTASNQHTLLAYMISQGASSWPRECPSGFSQHLAIVDNGCEINYCVKSGALSPQSLLKVKRPPFMSLPHVMYLIEEPDFVFNDDGSVWTSKAHAQAQFAAAAITTGKTVNRQKGTDTQSVSLSPGAAAGIGIAAAITGIIIAVVAFIVYRRRKGQLCRDTDPWVQTPTTSDSNFQQTGTYGDYNQESNAMTTTLISSNS